MFGACQDVLFLVGLREHCQGLRVVLRWDAAAAALNDLVCRVTLCSFDANTMLREAS
jgi:hypothetical protein